MASEADRCKYFEVCERPVMQRVGGDLFCILHLPLMEPEKKFDKFNQELEAYLAEGRSDLRWVYFPRRDPSFNGRHFSSTADFRDATFGGTLDLTGATFEKELLLGGPGFQNVNLSQATVRGALRVQGAIGTLQLHRTICHDSLDVEVRTSIKIEAYNAEFHGTLSIQVLEGNLDFHGTEFCHGLRVRGRYYANPGVRLEQSKISGHLDFRDSYFEVVSFREANFDPGVSLDLTGSKLRGELTLAGLETLPREITLDGAIISQNVRIEALLGAPRPRIIAAQRHPSFGGAVTFANVDLQECLLLGNVFDQMELSNIEWPHRWGRCVIRDEMAYRRQERIPLGNLREAYQALKQKYHDKGDHVRAGDFHYGEMEAKRREYGFPRRWCSWEFAYWLLSGYGVGHSRAFCILVVLVAGFAGLYSWTTPPGTFGSFSEALRYSIGVAGLQRPEMPDSFTELQKWLHVLEAILGPVQIALFALALRLRLKR